MTYSVLKKTNTRIFFHLTDFSRSKKATFKARSEQRKELIKTLFYSTSYPSIVPVSDEKLTPKQTIFLSFAIYGAA